MKPTPEQMRTMGFAANAEPVRLSDAAWLAFCAWVNLPPERVPAIQRYAPKATAEAWERVASAIEVHVRVACFTTNLPEEPRHEGRRTDRTSEVDAKGCERVT